MKRIQVAAMLGAFAWGVGGVWCSSVTAAQLTPVEAARNPSLVTPKTPAGAPVARATEQPTIRIVDPPDGATRTPGSLRVRIIARHVDLAGRATVSLTWSNSVDFGAFSVPAAATQLTQTVPLQQLVAGWTPPRSFVESAPLGVAISLEVFGDTALLRDHTSEGLVEGEFERPVQGMRAQATFRLVASDPAKATQRGGNATSAAPSPAAVKASGSSSGGVQPIGPQASASAPPPTTAAIRSSGQTGAPIRIVAPAAGSTTTPSATRVRVDYALHAASELADLELAWQDYATKTGPMQASLVTAQGSKTWQVSFGQLAAGFVIPADKICSCTNGHATLKVRPSGTSTWQDSVAFNVVAATPGGTTASSPKAWSQTQPSSSPSESSPARSTLLTSPAARAPAQPLAPASAFGRP